MGGKFGTQRKPDQRVVVVKKANKKIKKKQENKVQATKIFKQNET